MGHQHPAAPPVVEAKDKKPADRSRSPSPLSTPSPSGSASLAGDEHSGCSSCSSTTGGLSYELARKCTVSADSLLLHPDISGREHSTETADFRSKAAEAPVTSLRAPHLLHPTSSLEAAGTGKRKISGSLSSDQIHSHLMASSAPIDGTRSASPKMSSSRPHPVELSSSKSEEKRKTSVATAVLSGPGRLAARLLRRTHSAGCSKDTPSYALFLREKPSRSRDQSSTSEEQSSNFGQSERKPRRKPASGLEDMKQRLRFLRRRHTDSSLSSSVRPTPEEAQKWSSSFTQLMSSRYGSTLFKAFLSLEFSQENIEFWMAVEEYKKSRPSKYLHRAKKIYEDFIAVKSAKEINVDASLRSSIQTGLSNADISTFDVAQRKIQGLLESDAYVRFLQCELYKDLLVAQATSAKSPVAVATPTTSTPPTKKAPKEQEPDAESRTSSSSGKRSPETTL